MFLFFFQACAIQRVKINDVKDIKMNLTIKILLSGKMNRYAYALSYKCNEPWQKICDTLQRKSKDFHANYISSKPWRIVN